MRVLVGVAAAVAVALSACSVPPPGAGDAAPSSLAALSFPALKAPATCKGYVSLTFDDGPTLGSGRMLEVLRFYKIPAVFFNTGEHTGQLPAVIAAERAVPGVQFGNHSWNHPDLSTLPALQVREQLLHTKAVQGPTVTMFRPPFGSANGMVQKQIAAAGLLEVLWTKDSKDYAAASVEQVVKQASGMRDGGIVLLHDGHPMTVQALPDIIAGYYAQGLCFGRIARSRHAQAPVESPDLLFNARAVAP